MTARGVTREEILRFIAVDNEPIAMRRIVRYMMRTFGTSPTAVANHMRRLVEAGEVTRVGRGMYQAGA